MATQRRQALGLDLNSVVLQVVSVDEMQSTPKQAQAQGLAMGTDVVHGMAEALSVWMTAGKS